MLLPPKLNKLPGRQERHSLPPQQEPRRMLKNYKKPEKRKRNWPIRRPRHYKRRKRLKQLLNRHRLPN